MKYFMIILAIGFAATFYFRTSLLEGSEKTYFNKIENVDLTSLHKRKNELSKALKELANSELTDRQVLLFKANRLLSLCKIEARDLNVSFSCYVKKRYKRSIRAVVAEGNN